MRGFGWGRVVLVVVRRGGRSFVVGVQVFCSWLAVVGGG